MTTQDLIDETLASVPMLGDLILVHAGAIGEKQDHYGVCLFARLLPTGRYLLNVSGKAYVLAPASFDID